MLEVITMKNIGQVNIDLEQEKKNLDKYTNFYFLMNFWMKNIENGKHVEDFFNMRGYVRPAVYGMGDLGKHLVEQLPERLKPIYTIDAGIVKYNDECVAFDESKDILNKADVIVITPITDYENIRKMISGKVNVDIASLEEVILSI